MRTIAVVSCIVVSLVGCSRGDSAPIVFEDVEFSDGLATLRVEERGDVECVVFEDEGLEWCGEPIARVDRPSVIGVSGAGSGNVFQWVAVGVAPLGVNVVEVSIDDARISTSLTPGPEYSIWIVRLANVHESVEPAAPYSPDVRVRVAS